MQLHDASKRSLVAALAMMCMALVVLTIVAGGRNSPVVLKSAPIDKRWTTKWNWFARESASNQMKAPGANEGYRPLGSFYFDQGAVPWNN
mmetsp:Transcript_19853/g.38581  ORF Transcript_19853/g.38581 Transcript_19853/m.38581 type:complete len:90 (-) Transcript_19853:168-437(-)|eukprot:CAMPEP_0173379772 /NCGR_PEP_ID=MMETSP1356-20130122/2595_1 /TAXON_ID=77927 ORGANISM="Hemiselmis virescens, Strain PCC157" /NCGR_SAMPLE_ID=MMETSP1356 /ASSEMBLY_ACC=CAM_ASM_000847 /LENGTH=89 /DNA_ID=CAMNT_0014333171 /DNA_START=25 /DNA_END=294 /DNA_ORIENTATION=+